MTYFALNVQRCLVPDDQQVLVLVHENQVLVPDDQQALVLVVPGDQQALVLVPDDQQALVLHPKNKKKGKCYGQRTNCIVTSKKKDNPRTQPS
jgi:hypothetical protein